MQERQRRLNAADITMARTPLDPYVAAELRRLALLPDDDIDTSDAPEITDWSRAIRGRFSKVSLEIKGYDIRAIGNWVLDYLSELHLSASNMSLNKLLYFIFERSIIERGILLTPARVEAWDHGPVFREIYHAVKNNDDNPISTRIPKYSIRDRELIEAREQFDLEDIVFFRSVIDDYKGFTASRLRRISHRVDGPWERVWRSANPVNPGMVISVEMILSAATKQRDFHG